MPAAEPARLDRAELGLPSVGVKLDREQSLRWLAARDAGRDPVPEHVHAWAREVLGIRALAVDPASLVALAPDIPVEPLP